MRLSLVPVHSAVFLPPHSRLRPLRSLLHCRFLLPVHLSPSSGFRQFLQSAVPKYNSETGDAKLFVEFADQLASIYVERPEAADEIRTIIEQMTGKTVEVQLILADQHANAALSTISVDDALTQAIHGIPVEEDDESDFDDGEE